MSKEKRKPHRASKKPRATEKLSLHPLSLEEALRGAMETGVLPESPRKHKGKKRRKKNGESLRVVGSQMPLKVGDKVALKAPGGTVPEGQYTVVRIDGHRVAIRDQAGKQRTVDQDELRPFLRLGKIDNGSA